MYGVPTFLTIESKTYSAGSLRSGGVFGLISMLLVHVGDRR